MVLGAAITACEKWRKEGVLTLVAAGKLERERVRESESQRELKFGP
jgi:DNA replication protein DnaD